jgi:hypothetical protein
MDLPTKTPWSRRAKLVASALVALHVAAVFLAPMSFAVRPGSPAVDPLAALFRPYIQAMFLNHGYAFFAPDPGPNHLVEYTLKFDNGRQPETGRFPDIHEHYPRLLYHRHFMLSESLNNYYAPERAPRLPAEMDAEERSSELARWRASRDNYVALRDSLARHVAFANHAESAEIHRIRHNLLPPTQFTRAERDLDRPTRLDDPRTYEDLDKPAETQSTVEEYVPGISLPRGTR